MYKFLGFFLRKGAKRMSKGTKSNMQKSKTNPRPKITMEDEEQEANRLGNLRASNFIQNKIESSLSCQKISALMKERKIFNIINA